MSKIKTDPSLGRAVRQKLHDNGLLGPDNWQASTPPRGFAAAISTLQGGLQQALADMGLQINDPSLRETPARFAEMIVDELCSGLNWDLFPKCTTTPNDIGNNGLGYDQMVLVRDITLISLCEHHLQTIDGFVHIAYIPKTKVIGLSKLARVAEFFARRPQIQERLTEQIYCALSYVLETDDIAVVIDATHFCMRVRGVSQQQAKTQTDKMGGRFMTNPTLRSEFLGAIRA